MAAGHTPFNVTWMPYCLHAALDLGRRVGMPLNLRLRDVMLEADERLKESAREWGDPYADLKGMRVTLYARRYVRDGLVVRYAVHMEKDEVFVRSVEPIPGGPFDVE